MKSCPLQNGHQLITRQCCVDCVRKKGEKIHILGSKYPKKTKQKNKKTKKQKNKKTKKQKNKKTKKQKNKK
jgi:hypothetical protein